MEQEKSECCAGACGCAGSGGKKWLLVPVIAALAVVVNVATMGVNWMAAGKMVTDQLVPNAMAQANNSEQVLVRLATAMYASGDPQIRELLNKHGVNYNESTVPQAGK